MKEDRVIPKTEEKRTFACGHTSWARFSHQIAGEEFLILESVLESTEKCGECLLESATEGRTSCAVCGTPIFKGSDCILFEEQICCLGVKCSPGPIGAEVGIWDGERFVGAIFLGRIGIAGRYSQG